jgi:hypothetical protein
VSMMTEDRDRQVHATMKDGAEIVRYNREGHWYLEWPDGSERRTLRINDAVALATSTEVRDVFFNRPGGSAFDRKVSLINAVMP